MLEVVTVKRLYHAFSCRRILLRLYMYVGRGARFGLLSVGVAVPCPSHPAATARTNPATMLVTFDLWAIDLGSGSGEWRASRKFPLLCQFLLACDVCAVRFTSCVLLRLSFVWALGYRGECSPPSIRTHPPVFSNLGVPCDRSQQRWVS